jgi:hypothetical protein
MKMFLIAAGIAAAMLVSASSALAQDMRPGMNESRSNEQMRRDHARETMARDDQRMGRGTDRGWRGGHGKRCRTVKRHHRWVRVCNNRR